MFRIIIKKLFGLKILFVLIYYDFYITNSIGKIWLVYLLRRSHPAFQKLKAEKNEMALPSRYVVNANNAIQILIGEISIGHCIYTIAVYRRRRKRRHAQSDIESKKGKNHLSSHLRAN